MVQGITCKVVLPSHSAHLASHRKGVLRAKHVEVSQMGQMRLELLQIPSISCLAYIFLPVYARRTLAGFASICLLWDKWWQAIVAPKCQPFYMQCHQEQTVTSICGGTVL